LNTDGNLGNSLAGLTIVEIGDQLGDYAAMLLAGLGAEVIKLEPRDGSASRRIGPFASTAPDPEQSIFFWRYNLNKKSVVLDVDDLDIDALELLRMTRFVLPLCMIAVYSGTLRQSWALACHLAGANCLLAKSSDKDQIVTGLRQAFTTGCFTDPSFASA